MVAQQVFKLLTTEQVGQLVTAIQVGLQQNRKVRHASG